MSRKHHKKAFIFDLDGTLIDSGRDLVASANFTRVHYGLSTLAPATVLSLVGGGAAVLVEGLLKIDDPLAAMEHGAEALAVFKDHYGRHCLDHTAAYPGVLATLRRLAVFPLMIATNKPRDFTLKILDGLRLDGAFCRIVTGDDVARKKPDPEPLRHCLEGIAAVPSEVVMIGDSPKDIAAARALGCMAVGCTYGLCPAGEITAAQPDLVIDAFGELNDHFATRNIA